MHKFNIYRKSTSIWWFVSCIFDETQLFIDINIMSSRLLNSLSLSLPLHVRIFNSFISICIHGNFNFSLKHKLITWIYLNLLGFRRIENEYWRDWSLNALLFFFGPSESLQSKLDETQINLKVYKFHKRIYTLENVIKHCDRYCFSFQRRNWCRQSCPKLLILIQIEFFFRNLKFILTSPL